MRPVLLLCAAALAAAFVPGPATGQSLGRSADSGSRDGDGRHHRHHRDGRDAVFVGPLAPEGWALFNNRSWAPDSYNDWWHDRPDRAFPRWVQHNRNCTADRMWWSGSGWHC